MVTILKSKMQKAKRQRVISKRNPFKILNVVLRFEI